MPLMDLDTVADELYALPLDEFTASRTGAEKRARDAGDRDLAAKIHSLAKPNVAAWLLNQLARERRKELRPLLDLGAELREATRELAGDRLRELSKRQQELVQALVQQARALAEARGQSVGETVVRGVQETLHAALVDEGAEAQLLAGRLSATLHRSGLGDGLDSAPLAAKKPAKRVAGKQPAATPVAEEKQAKAQRARLQATKARDDAQAKATAADAAADAAQHEVDRLRSELEAARAVSAKAEKIRRERTGALRRAERALGDAERRPAR